MSSRIEQLVADVDALLATADAELSRRYPGDRGRRQPVHTVYLPADQYGEQTVATWGREALDLLDTHHGAFAELTTGLGLAPSLTDDLDRRVRDKLAREPVEDLRIDFEDGYGSRPDDEEDAAAIDAARVLAASAAAGTAPPYAGLRFKSLESPTRRRGLRTLDLFVAELVDLGGLPTGFVVTLPKVTSVDQVAAMVHCCARLETAHGLPERLRFEIQVETPQSILGPDGTALVAPMIQAAAGRCTGLHYGTYDYSAACGIAASQQSMGHPAADHAKAVMQVAAAGTGVHLSDGSTNVLPVGDDAAVRAAWELHARLVRRSLERGFYQGWDLHPGQLVSRYAAVFVFFREGLPAAAERLRAYVGETDSGYLDEPATAVALAGFVVHGVECGAVDEAEAVELTGIAATGLRALARRAGETPGRAASEGPPG
ncbi:MAG: aldolase [Propionibacteriales bacterium]|nr:aldolase [Propionibacteriales bacterium]